MLQNKIRKHFQFFTLNQFQLIIVVSFIILDVLNSLYLKNYWIEKDLTKIYLKKMAQMQGMSLSHLAQNSLNEIQNLISLGFTFLILLFFFNNLFFYIFYLRKKIWAEKYVLFYAFSNAILGIIFILEGPVTGLWWYFYNMMTVIIYCYCFWGGQTHRLPVIKKNP